MKTRGILFRPDLHQAILAGKKTETRRLDLGWAKLRKGDRLYVKEQIVRSESETARPHARYHADNAIAMMHGSVLVMPWRWERAWLSPLHMPRECARTWLELVEGGRVERLQDITEEGAKAEGVHPLCYRLPGQGVNEDGKGRSYRHGFRDRWDEVHPDQPWISNPEVAVLRFRMVTP